MESSRRVAFVAGRELHGNEWLEVAKIVKTRNKQQVAKYAVGYFKRANAGKPGILNFISNSDPSQRINLLLLLLNGRLFSKTFISMMPCMFVFFHE